MTRPREIAPGIVWLPACQEHAYMGSLLHSCNSVYLVSGTAWSLLVEAGHPRDLDAIEEELSILLRAAPELRYVFTTHIQTGSASGAERWLRRWPQAELCGDVRDLHLVFPRLEHRLRPLAVGDALDLGNTEFVAVEAVIRDHASSLWGYDTARRVLFSGRGLRPQPLARAGALRKLAEETLALDLPDMTAVFAEVTLPWPRLTDMEPYIRRLDEAVLRELDVALIAPTHGLPISDPRGTLPRNPGGPPPRRASVHRAAPARRDRPGRRRPDAGALAGRGARRVPRPRSRPLDPALQRVRAHVPRGRRRGGHAARRGAPCWHGRGAGRAARRRRSPSRT